MASKPQFVPLRRKRDFDQLRSEGRILHPCAWLMVSFQPNDLDQTRCGWTLPKYVGSAATRNKLKRWGREFLRKWTKQNGLSVDINFIFKRQRAEFYRELAHGDFDHALEKALLGIRRWSRS